MFFQFFNPPSIKNYLLATICVGSIMVAAPMDDEQFLRNSELLQMWAETI